jgi:orotidine-5'-phosphate decarboxylase
MEKTAENKGKMKVIAVTVLTNLDQKDLNEMGFDPKVSVEDLVLKRTEMAINSGLDGVVASGIAAKTLRQNLGNDFLIVSPGIRLEAVAEDDQKQVCDVKTAINNGSSYLVVGRPITRASNPQAAAKHFASLI